MYFKDFFFLLQNALPSWHCKYEIILNVLPRKIKFKLKKVNKNVIILYSTAIFSNMSIWVVLMTNSLLGYKGYLHVWQRHSQTGFVKSLFLLCIPMTKGVKLLVELNCWVWLQDLDENKARKVTAHVSRFGSMTGLESIIVFCCSSLFDQADVRMSLFSDLHSLV